MFSSASEAVRAHVPGLLRRTKSTPPAQIPPTFRPGSSTSSVTSDNTDDTMGTDGTDASQPFDYRQRLNQNTREIVLAQPPAEAELVHYDTSRGTRPRQTPDQWTGLARNVMEAARQQYDGPESDEQLLDDLHVDAVRYINLSLPDRLSDHNTKLYVRYLPQSVREEVERPLREELARQNHQGEQPHAQKTFLRRLTASTVERIILLAIFLAPFIIACLSAAIRYEREHNIMRRCWSFLVSLVIATGIHQVDLQRPGTRAAVNRLAQVLLATSLWISDGLSGGMSDGWSRTTEAQGALMIENRSPAKERRMRA